MKFFAIATIAAVSANQYDSMNEDELLVNLESTLSSALSSEARGDGDAAVAKTAAIKNIQKALTARILKRLDDGQPLVEVARKMKAIEGMQPQINDMERRLGIMQSVEPVLENAIKTLQKVVDVRGMGKKWAHQLWSAQPCHPDFDNERMINRLKQCLKVYLFLKIYKYLFKNLRNKMLRFKIHSIFINILKQFVAFLVPRVSSLYFRLFNSAHIVI